MSASPAADALPLVPEADDPVSQSWMYRSEAFAEDLDDAATPAPPASARGARGTMLRLTWPLYALMLGVGIALAYGLP